MNNKNERDQTQTLLWTATATAFLFISFRMRIMEDIGHSPYLPWIAVGLLLLQLVNYELASVSLRKKSPSYTNDFYGENARMIVGNIIASALVLELNVHNYMQYSPNILFEVISIPFSLFIIFYIENARGGFLAMDRIYFPKKWDRGFKNYGVNIISVSLMILMWLPVVLKIPISAPLWILISTILLKESVAYTNKYNHVGWCFALEGLLVLQILTLGFQGNYPIFVAMGILAGIIFLAVYMKRIGFGKGLMIAASIVYTAGILLFYLYQPQKLSVITYLQMEIGFFSLIFLIAKLFSKAYGKLRKKEAANKYSYEGAVVEERTESQSGQAKQTHAKVSLKSKTKPSMKLHAKAAIKPQAKLKTKEQAKPQVKTKPKPQPKPQAKPQTKAKAKPQPKPQVKPQAKPQVKAQPKSQAKPQPMPQGKPQVKPQTKSQVKAQTSTKANPQVKQQVKAQNKAVTQAKSQKSKNRKYFQKKKTKNL